MRALFIVVCASEVAAAKLPLLATTTCSMRFSVGPAFASICASMAASEVASFCA